MSETNILKWVGCILGWSAFLVGYWWCGMLTASPNWVLFGLLSAIWIVSEAGGFLSGYSACLKTYHIEQTVKMPETLNAQR